MGIKLFLYGIASTVLATTTISYALHTREQFYPTVVFLVTSKFSIVVLGNFAIFCTLMTGQLAKAIFLGQLRDQEREIMFDRARYTIFDTCLTLTIFHEEITMRVFVLFTALLFSKVFHWLSECRVEHVEQDDAISRWQHTRLISLMMTLLVTDLVMMGACSWLASKSMPSVLILFGFEYANLSVTALTTFGKYLLHLMDMRVEGSWQEKWSYVKLLEIISEAIHFVLLLFFFATLFMYYGLPLHVIRELGLSFMNLQKYVKQFKKHRKLMSGLNDRFPDATEQEMQNDNGDMNECIICRDPLAAGAKKLPCNHVFHLDCLRLWLQEKNGCPTCRAIIPLDGPVPTNRHHHPHPLEVPRNVPVVREEPVANPPLDNPQAPTPVPPINAVPPAGEERQPAPPPTEQPLPRDTPAARPPPTRQAGNAGGGGGPEVSFFAIPRSRVRDEASIPSQSNFGFPHEPMPSFGGMCGSMNGLNCPPAPLVLRVLTDTTCTRSPQLQPGSTDVTRALPAGVYVLVGGCFPPENTASPTHWMTVDADWINASNVVVVPAPPLSSMMANTTPSFGQSDQPIPNPFARYGNMSNFGNNFASPFGNVPSMQPSVQPSVQPEQPQARTEAINTLDLEIQKLRTELNNLKAATAKQESEVDTPPDGPPKQQGASWAESPFASPGASLKKKPAADTSDEGMELYDDKLNESGLRQRKPATTDE
mmetsp:Transcript_48679/g.62472  ORF Transcript_48679/g.62472 Transcript_48679/m.62472 type:complete len:708 (-) Transcript_48679:148-2271(-)